MRLLEACLKVRRLRDAARLLAGDPAYEDSQTDAAGEGINLQFCCRTVNYDGRAGGAVTGSSVDRQP